MTTISFNRVPARVVRSAHDVVYIADGQIILSVARVTTEPVPWAAYRDVSRPAAWAALMVARRGW